MMKKKNLFYITILMGIILSSTLFSCRKSFLEITPKGRLVAESVNDYELLGTSLDLLNIGVVTPIPMGDDVATINEFFLGSSLITQRYFKWEAKLYEDNENAPELGTPLRNIYTYNKIINEVMDAKDGSEEQKRSIKARALVGRAWTYFLLINYYGKPYTEATAATDPGFPIITVADVGQTDFKRASVKEVYNFIIDDLTEALPNLPVQTSHRLKASKAVAEGLLGKVYVFTEQYDKALPLLKAAVADVTNSTIQVRLYNYNTTFATGGSFLPISASTGPAYPTVVNNEEVMYGKQISNSYALNNNELVVNPSTSALFGASDLRLKFYPKSATNGRPFPLGMMRKTLTAVQVGLVLPDVYLLLAEVSARLDDLSGAKANVELLRRNRMPANDATVPTAIAANKQDLVKFILNERQREFALSGYRWFDMRRLSVDPVYNNTVGYTHNVYTSTGTVQTTYTLQSERFVLRFAQKIINLNPQITNNP